MMTACKKLNAASAHASIPASPSAVSSPRFDESGSPVTPNTSGSNASAPPVSLAPAPEASSPYTTPVMNTGPCVSSYVIPPRPKPGRKPATDDPPSKRKQQNREAQRAFRQRKTQRMEEANHKLQRALDERRQQADIHACEVARLRDALQQQHHETVQLASENASLRQQLGLAGDAMAKLESEIDDRRRRRLPQNLPTTPATAMPPITLPPLVCSEHISAKDGCGRCRDNGDCPCVDSLVDFSGSNHGGDDNAMEVDFTSVGKKPVASRLPALEPPCKPGTCDACMKDPLQKRFCETLARERPVDHSYLAFQPSCASDVAADNGQANTRALNREVQNESINCAEAYRRYFRTANLPVNDEHPAWMRELITLPPAPGDTIRLQQLKNADEAQQTRHMSAYELDMASVLNVLKKADKRHGTERLPNGNLHNDETLKARTSVQLDETTGTRMPESDIHSPIALARTQPDPDGPDPSTASRRSSIRCPAFPTSETRPITPVALPPAIEA